MSKATLVLLVLAVLPAVGCDRSSPTETLPNDLNGTWSGSMTVQWNGRPDATCHLQVYLYPHEHMEEEDIGTSQVDCVSAKTNFGNVFFNRRGSSYVLDSSGALIDPETALNGCSWEAMLRRIATDRIQGTWSPFNRSLATGCPADLRGGTLELSKGAF